MPETLTVSPGSFRIIYHDGKEAEVSRKPTMAAIRIAIAAPQALDTVNLRNGCVMIVDDTGMIDGRPVNAKATEAYHSVCRPDTIHPICGDVVIAVDEDFA